MIFLKLRNIDNVPFTINMSRVDFYHSDGAGHTVFVYGEESTYKAKESVEEVDDMVNAAMSYPGIVSKENLLAVVR